MKTERSATIDCSSSTKLVCRHTNCCRVNSEEHVRLGPEVLDGGHVNVTESVSPTENASGRRPTITERRSPMTARLYSASTEGETDRRPQLSSVDVRLRDVHRW